MKILILSMFIFSLFQFSTFAEKIYEIPIYDHSREPLVIIKEGKYSGLFIEALELILDRAQVKFKFIPLPNERRRQGFIDEKYLISCCSNESWRTKNEEVKIQRFSDFFLESNDIFIFSDQKLLKVKDLSKLKFALIKGYDYGGFENSIEKKYSLQTESTLLSFLSLGRAQVGIIDESIFDFYSSVNSSLYKGRLFKSSKLKIRVNKKEMALLESINKAIKELKNDGAFNLIKEKYKTKVHLGQILQGPSLSLLKEAQ